MMLNHKVLDCAQVAIGTGQREWGITSLVDWLCGRPPSYATTYVTALINTYSLDQHAC